MRRMSQQAHSGPNMVHAVPLVIQRDLTAEVYFSLAESSQPQNLIDGLLYVSPRPGEAHEDAVLAIAVALREYGRTRGGQAFIGRDCWLDEATVLQPDVAYVTAERRTAIVGRFLRGAPDLVVEVIEPGTYAFDTEAKFEAYGKHGVREAWFVDPDAQAVTVVLGDGTAWQREHAVVWGDSLPSGLAGVGSAGLVKRL
jgi:Uma2 family endonuclease